MLLPQKRYRETETASYKLPSEFASGIHITPLNANLLDAILFNTVLLDTQEVLSMPRAVVRTISSLSLLALYRAVMAATPFPRLTSARDRRSRKASHASSRLSWSWSQVFPSCRY